MFLWIRLKLRKGASFTSPSKNQGVAGQDLARNSFAASKAIRNVLTPFTNRDLEYSENKMFVYYLARMGV